MGRIIRTVISVKQVKRMNRAEFIAAMESMIENMKKGEPTRIELPSGYFYAGPNSGCVVIKTSGVHTKIELFKITNKGWE